MQVSRRGIVIGALAGGGLAAGYLLRPRTFPLPLEPGRGEVALDAWIKIARDGVISVAVPQLEMGQGISTLLPQVIAGELGADWRQIAVEPAPVSAHYANLPLAAHWSELWMPAMPQIANGPDSLVTRRWAQDHRFQVTADGMSLAAYEIPAREAAASLRAVLAKAAAARWDVAWEECSANDGFIIHGKKREAFAALAEEAAAFAPPDPPPLKPAPPREDPKDFPAGTDLPYPRLDLPSKADGSYQFAGDVRLPDMVFAAIRHGPVARAELTRFEKNAARGSPGLLSVVKGKRWLAAVATNWWAAEQALGKMKPHFKVSGLADSETIDEALDNALTKGKAVRVHQEGEPDGLLQENFDMAKRYDVAPALHGTIETASAAARISDGKLELWMATQAPEAARKAAAAALDFDVRDVVLYPMPAGGSFDRRLEVDHAIEAALIAREAGKPVSLMWSRWQEHVAGWPRTPVAALMGARSGPDGRLIGWRARLALPPSAREFGRRLIGGETHWSARESVSGEGDALAMEGAIPPYSIAHMSIEHVPVDIDLPTARLRGNAHGYTAFFTECFIDELAHEARREPLSFRMAMLGADLRLAECLQRVAALSQWSGGVDNSGQGLACHVIDRGEGTGRIAVVATARQAEGGVRVDKIFAVADIGRIVNLDIARQQIEGGLVFGLGLAIGSGTSYSEGLPTSRGLRELGLPLLADCPQIEVEFIASNSEPADPGELGVAAVAPAIANALFSATGLRFRRLPLLSEGL